MKIVETITTFDDGCKQSLEIAIDYKTHILFRDGEPEDSNISRDFNDVMKITDFMKLAYEAGVRGESFEVEIINVEEK